MTRTVPINGLQVSPHLQLRRGGVCSDTVREYAEAAKGGAEFPPLVAYSVTDRQFKKPVLVAGFHRLEAYKAAGLNECAVDVREGTWAEAWLAAWSSNLTHGLRYTNADKRAAVETALKLFTDESARAVAERLNVSAELVNKIRKEMVTAGAIQEPEKVKGRDGRKQATTKEQSNNRDVQVPTVGTCHEQASEYPEATDPTEIDFGEPEPVEPEPLGDLEEPPVSTDVEEAVAAVHEEQTADRDATNKLIKDGLGAYVPRGLADTFGDPMLADCIARITAAHRELISIEKHILNTLSRKGEFWPYALFGESAKSLAEAANRTAEAHAQLSAGVPFCVCPKCKGDGCKDCRNSGAWPKHRYENREQYGDAK